MKIFILGSGNWGTTLGILFAQKNDVILWTINEEQAEEINKKRENIFFLPGIKLPENMQVEKKYTSVINEDDIIIMAVPSRRVSEVCDELIEQNIKNNIIVNVSKGVKHTTLQTIKDIVKKKIPTARFANLSGPTISREIAEGLPAKAIIASDDIALLFYLQETLQNSLLKFGFSRDVEGIELCASLKGLVAIAVGIADGLGFKTNIFGLIMTYGLQDFTTIMEFLNVPTKTVYGIAGMGDLITTCLSENSRNRRFGKFLAQGKNREDALKAVGMVVEGVSMAKTVQKLSKFNLSIPMISVITRIIFEENIDIKKELMTTLNSI